MCYVISLPHTVYVLFTSLLHTVHVMLSVWREIRRRSRERNYKCTATCKINGNLQRFSTAYLNQFATGTPSERFPFILQAAVSHYHIPYTCYVISLPHTVYVLCNLITTYCICVM